MKLTDKHVSEKCLNILIEHYSKWGDVTIMEQETSRALLELKHRRAEDRFNETVTALQTEE